MATLTFWWQVNPWLQSSGRFAMLLDNVELVDLPAASRISGLKVAGGLHVVTNCRGFRTSNRGVGQIASDQSSVVINHNPAGFVPAEEDVLIQTLTASNLVITVPTITPTSFTVQLSGAASAIYYFKWQIDGFQRGFVD